MSTRGSRWNAVAGVHANVTTSEMDPGSPRPDRPPLIQSNALELIDGGLMRILVQGQPNVSNKLPLTIARGQFHDTFPPTAVIRNQTHI